jgi:oligosaccharyltransferase complex subunit delta (ribophorin II)
MRPRIEGQVLTARVLCRLNQKTPLAKPVSLGSTDTLKLGLTAKDNGQGKRPHQAFLVLQEQDSGLEAPFPLTVKESGKAVVQIVRGPLATVVVPMSC